MSEIDRIISPEVSSSTPAYHALKKYLKTVPATSVIEIGASSGAGSTEALIEGLVESGRDLSDVQVASLEISQARFALLKDRYKYVKFFKPYNMSSIPVQLFPSKAEVSQVITDTGIHQGNVNMVMGWYDQDVNYLINHQMSTFCGIDQVKQDFHVSSFSLAMIDGSEFTGNIEYEMLPDCDAYFLDDIYAYKNLFAHKSLLIHPEYELIFVDNFRNGSSLFCKKEIAQTYNL